MRVQHDIVRNLDSGQCVMLILLDTSAAFDTVGRTGLWQLLRKYGWPEKFTTIIEALHTGMMAIVSVEGKSRIPSMLQMGAS